MATIEQGFLISTEPGTESASVDESTPAVGAVSSALLGDLCKKKSTEPRLADFPTFAAYMESAEKFFLPERVSAEVAALGPVVVDDKARGEQHPDIPGAMRIPLGDGYFAVIDEDDYPLVRRYEWFLHINGYAWTRTVHLGRDVSLPMHRLVLMLSADCSLDVDHVNGDKLENRKANLRACTRAQNLWNQRLSRSNTSGFKGVFWHKASQSWIGAVKANGVRHTKSFRTAKEANEWARAKREELHGEFARHE